MGVIVKLQGEAKNKSENQENRVLRMEVMCKYHRTVFEYIREIEFQSCNIQSIGKRDKTGL